MTSGDKVIVRAYGDEPVQVYFARWNDAGGPNIYRAHADTVIGWPRDCIFEWDADLYGRMRAAYDTHDEAALAALWREAKLLRKARG